MPRFEYKMLFNVQLVNGAKAETPEEKEQVSERFDNMSSFMKGFTGIDVGRHVDIMGSPRFHNFKLMLDVFPFKNKNWHATVGFYAGRSNVAKAYNTQQAMTSLLAVKLYNEIYWRCMNYQPMFEYNNDKTNMHITADIAGMDEVRGAFKAYGTLSMLVGYFKEDYYAKQDIPWDHDVYEIYRPATEDETPYMRYDEAKNKWVEDFENGTHVEDPQCIHKRGDVRYHEGELAYKAGDPYYLLPDQVENMIKVNAIVNKIRPYVGVGYTGAISKDKRSQISVDLGAMFWGGVPKMLTHDGVDLARDLNRIDGQVKRYVNIAQKLNCFPVFELRFSQRIF